MNDKPKKIEDNSFNDNPQSISFEVNKNLKGNQLFYIDNINQENISYK